MRNFPSIFETIEDLEKEQVDGLLKLAQKFKNNPDIQHGQSLFLGRKPIVANSFLEDSTRTKNSFAIAIHKLGCTYLDFNAETSSLKKGESLEETLLTLYAQGVDLCIVRTSQSRELNGFKDSPPIKVINGGDGTHQHPTQALLDLMTLIDLAGGEEELRGKVVTIVGDAYHSRVTHSLMALLPLFGVKIIICGPKCFQVPPETLNDSISQTDQLEPAIEKADFIYLLRIQLERHRKLDITNDQAEILKNYHQHYGLNPIKLNKINSKAPLLHPGPANIGTEIDRELIKSRRYKGHLQVYNSVFMRMAIIASILQNGDKNIGYVDEMLIRE